MTFNEENNDEEADQRTEKNEVMLWITGEEYFIVKFLKFILYFYLYAIQLTVNTVASKGRLSDFCTIGIRGSHSWLSARTPFLSF